MIAEEGSSRALVCTRGEATVLWIGSSFYLLTALFSNTLYVSVFGIPREVSYSNLSQAVWLHQLVGTTLGLFPALLFSMLLLRPSSPLRSAMRGINVRLAAVLVAAASISVLLNLLSLWPFTWTSPANSTPIHVANLWGHHHWFGLGLLAIRTVVFVPFVEEVIFRFALLRMVARRTNSVHAGIYFSAALFAILHISPTGDLVAFLNGIWLFIFSVIFGYIAAGPQGSILPGLVAHIGRNGTELVALLFAIADQLAAY